jgi:hypothetical protein
MLTVTVKDMQARYFICKNFEPHNAHCSPENINWGSNVTISA